MQESSVKVKLKIKKCIREIYLNVQIFLTQLVPQVTQFLSRSNVFSTYKGSPPPKAPTQIPRYFATNPITYLD